MQGINGLQIPSRFRFPFICTFILKTEEVPTYETILCLKAEDHIQIFTVVVTLYVINQHYIINILHESFWYMSSKNTIMV